MSCNAKSMEVSLEDVEHEDMLDEEVEQDIASRCGE